MKRLYYMIFVVKRIAQKILGDHAIKIRFVEPSDEQFNQLLAEKLDSGEAFCLLRPGNGEYSFVQQYDEYKLFKSKRYRKQKAYEMLDNNEEMSRKWCEQFQRDMKDADIWAYFGKYAVSEEYLTRVYLSKDAKQVLLRQLESHFTASISWIQHLAGKKVLIINPFVDQIQEQYERKELVWGEKQVLPEMDMRYLKSVWYMNKDDNDGFATWFDALEYMIKQVEQIDFDVALIGCGPFSTFLATHIKRMGKVGIQYGGALQMLFGVRGSRWDENESYKQYYNEYWVRASKNNAPKSTKNLDDGCYW